MEVCAITGVQIPTYTPVVLIPLVQVRNIDRDPSPLYTKGAHCYFEPVAFRIFGKTEDDTVFEADEDAHLEDLTKLFGYEDSYELVDNILQGGELPEALGRDGIIGDCFHHVFILRSVWDALGEDPRLERYVETDGVISSLEGYNDLMETCRSRIESETDPAVVEVLKERLQYYQQRFRMSIGHYAGLNVNSVHLYGSKLVTYKDIFRKNNLLLHWMNAFGRMLMPCFPGRCDFKDEYLKLARKAYNSVKKGY
jgi:hypothetical protein